MCLNFILIIMSNSIIFLRNFFLLVCYIYSQLQHIHCQHFSDHNHSYFIAAQVTFLKIKYSHVTQLLYDSPYCSNNHRIDYTVYTLENLYILTQSEIKTHCVSLAPDIMV
jgi:hypothetical protein